MLAQNDHLFVLYFLEAFVVLKFYFSHFTDDAKGEAKGSVERFVGLLNFAIYKFCVQISHCYPSNGASLPYGVMLFKKNGDFCANRLGKQGYNVATLPINVKIIANCH